MFNNYNEALEVGQFSRNQASETADEAYKTHIKKLYPNMTLEEMNDMFGVFKKEMARQAEKSKERDASLRK